MSLPCVCVDNPVTCLGNLDCDTFAQSFSVSLNGVPVSAIDCNQGQHRITVFLLDCQGNGLTAPTTPLVPSVGTVDFVSAGTSSQAAVFNYNPANSTTSTTVTFSLATLDGNPDDQCSIDIPHLPCTTVEKQGFPTAEPPEIGPWNIQQVFPQGAGATTTWFVGANNTDPVKVTCITNNVPGAEKQHAYAKRGAINCDNTKVLIVGFNGGGSCVVDVATGVQTALSFSGEVSFSAVDPNKIIGLLGNDQLSCYDCSTGQYDDYVGVTGETMGQGEGRPSHNDDCIVLESGDVYTAWDLTTNTVKATINGNGANWGGISPTGNYIVLSYPTASPDYFDVYDFNGNFQFSSFGPAGQLEHGDLAQDCNGQDIYTSIGFGEPYWVDLATGKMYKWTFTNAQWIINGHVSGIGSVKRPGYVGFSSTDPNSSGGEAAAGDLFMAQACPTNTPATFLNAPNFTNPAGICLAASSDAEYWGSSGATNSLYINQPKAAVSPDGTAFITTHFNGIVSNDYLVQCL